MWNINIKAIKIDSFPIHRDNAFYYELKISLLRGLSICQTFRRPTFNIVNHSHQRITIDCAQDNWNGVKSFDSKDLRGNGRTLQRTTEVYERTVIPTPSRGKQME